MEKVKLNKVEREEVKALEEARTALDNANEALDNATDSLNEAKASKAKNKASLVGNAYIAFCEALQDRDDKLIAYSEAIENAKNNAVTFPTSDSKEEWVKRGLSNEYNAISLWYKVTDSILEAIKASIFVSDSIDKEDIKNYINCYYHQITNANDMVRLGFIDENSNIIVKNKSNYAFINKEARQSTEAINAKNQAKAIFQVILEKILDTFIE